MLSELLKKYLEENVTKDDPEFELLDHAQSYCADAERFFSGNKEQADEGNAVSEIESEAMNLVCHCFDTAWDIATSRVIPSELQYGFVIKLTEIMMDYIKHKQQTEAIESLVEYFKPKVVQDLVHTKQSIKDVIESDGWKEFSSKTFGSMTYDPIDGGDQGQFEKRVDVEYEKQDEKLVTSDDLKSAKENVTPEPGIAVNPQSLEDAVIQRQFHHLFNHKIRQIQRCPVCDGCGSVPGGFYKRKPNANPGPCRSCNGKGYI